MPGVSAVQFHRPSFLLFPLVSHRRCLWRDHDLTKSGGFLPGGGKQKPPPSFFFPVTPEALAVELERPRERPNLLLSISPLFRPARLTFSLTFLHAQPPCKTPRSAHKVTFEPPCNLICRLVIFGERNPISRQRD